MKFGNSILKGLKRISRSLCDKSFLEQQGWQAVYVDHQGINKDLLKVKLEWGEVESIFYIDK